MLLFIIRDSGVDTEDCLAVFGGEEKVTGASRANSGILGGEVLGAGVGGTRTFRRDPFSCSLMFFSRNSRSLLSYSKSWPRKLKFGEIEGLFSLI